jgi:hypothetical protein
MSNDREDRAKLGKAIGQGLHQCGIGVQYLMSGPAELFDVADVVMKSDFWADHDARVRVEARQEALNEAAEQFGENQTTREGDVKEWLRARAVGVRENEVNGDVQPMHGSEGEA